MTIVADTRTVAADLAHRVEQRRIEVSGNLDRDNQRRLGQFFTPFTVAEYIASRPRLDQSHVLTVLDPGAGIGVLSAALAARALRERPELAVKVIAIEVDGSLRDALEATLNDCQLAFSRVGCTFDYEVVSADFISWGIAQCFGSLDDCGELSSFDIVIQNPPYGKIGHSSSVHRTLAAWDIRVPNVYAAFLAIGARLLARQGQLVAITPRSFCNGSYFEAFRRDLLQRIGLDCIAVFHERDSLFADSAVLQETVVFSGTSGRQSDRIEINSARSYLDQPHVRHVPSDHVLRPEDSARFIRIPTDADDDEISALMGKLPSSLADLGVTVSTGRVVDFRVADLLLERPAHGAAPLIYPQHFGSGRVSWPAQNSRRAKPNAIVRTVRSEPLLLPAGAYVLVKRMSSKEEHRRVVAALFRPEDVPAAAIAFENHLNVFHCAQNGLNGSLAVGLTAWLNSSMLDLYFRQFSGHTQVNATDLRNMLYPDKDTLVRLGRGIDIERWPAQDELDEIVRRHVLGLAEETDHVATPTSGIVEEARDVLRALNFDAERSNARSALALLALARLRPDQRWSDAGNPMLRTVEIMDFLRQHHGRDYKPNTRETIRRQTLHQFVDAGLISQNPDRPDRPINSPKWCYQLTEHALRLLRLYHRPAFESALRDYLADLPGLKERYAVERTMVRIPLTLPGGRKSRSALAGRMS